MQQYALACVAERALGWGIAQKKPGIIENGTGRENGGWHRGEPRAPIKSMKRAMT
jgi:hypothetical protein